MEATKLPRMAVLGDFPCWVRGQPKLDVAEPDRLAVLGKILRYRRGNPRQTYEKAPHF